MKFNEKLVQGLSPSDVPLAEVILFFIERKYNLYHFFQIRDGKMIIADDLYEDVQRITGVLLEQDRLIPEYLEESLVRLSPTYPLYVAEGTQADFEVDRVRSHFPVGQKSDKITVTKLLNEFFAKHPQYNIEDVEEATKAYIRHCKMIDRTIRDCNNFIIDDDEVSMLLQWLEEIESKQSNNWRNKVE